MSASEVGGFLNLSDWYAALGGESIDATVVPAPKQRNTEAENAAIKQGKIPER
jgi:hypothetical protein